MRPFGFPSKTRVDGSHALYCLLMCECGLFFPYDLKRSFCIHCKIDRHLNNVDDKTPVASATADDEAHELHEVEGLPFNFGRRALQHVHAHSI